MVAVTFVVTTNSTTKNKAVASRGFLVSQTNAPSLPHKFLSCPQGERINCLLQRLSVSLLSPSQVTHVSSQSIQGISLAHVRFLSVLMVSTNLCVLQFWSVGSLLSPNTTTLDTECSCSVLCGSMGHSEMNFSFLQQGSPVSEGLNSPCFPKSHFVVVVVTQLKPNKRFLHTITSHLELVEGAVCLSSPQLETSRFARLSPHKVLPRLWNPNMSYKAMAFIPSPAGFLVLGESSVLLPNWELSLLSLLEALGG